MLLLAGLGNPGEKYRGHRHNVGFMVLDEIQDQYLLPAWRSKFDALISEGVIGGQKTCLIKPMTFMNDSGRAVGKAMRFYKLQPSDVIVLHDELDLAPFKLRIKTGGGVAGHNGLKSIAAHLGTRDFKRVRIGIGHPGNKAKVHGYVLGNYSKAEEQPLETMIAAMSDHAGLLTNGDESGYMNKVALALQPPK